MKKIAYIIGFRYSNDDDRRMDNLILTLKWLIEIKKCIVKHIDLQIIVIEQDSKKKFNIAENIQNELEYLFIYNDGYYNRGWAFNVGYKSFSADYYFFADGDIIMKNIDMIYVFTSCFKYEAVNPYEHIYDSTKEYVTDPNFDPLIWKEPKNLSERTYTCFSGGIMGIEKNAMQIIAGWDERFRGRGWEDYAFTAKIKLFLYSIHTYSFNALHLWHPWEINTTREINEKLNAEYERYHFDNYVDVIEMACEFGSPIKYASLHTIIKNHKYVMSESRYKYGYEQYKNAKKHHFHTKKIFLYLCEQLYQLQKNNSNSIKESGT
ncbi:glycosyltransferase family A domain-containing protein [Bodo saltans virus]|uniref:Glycosyltransferase family A domain-containing protein n=1 Tax=Bodo saltans virus TaxID=2024608 RepID=A0A2H4UTM2_9VIRU|nr:glycosyltransferase family A domain-containing protein [Bodo saltans virus]ATZ80199.1 glycosyltransferase family A domain-containing protein [Bodo saltans virus]